MNRDASTLPPPPAELRGVEDFEQTIRTQGEARARLSHLVRTARRSKHELANGPQGA